MATCKDSVSTADSGDLRRISALRALQFPRYALLPGDPDRVTVMADQWDDSTVIDLPRGYRAAVGTFREVRIGAVSTGIGAPSFEQIFSDLASLGVDTFVRVGTTGSVRENIGNGALIINDASVRLDGTSPLYVRAEFPAAAAFEVTLSLVDAATEADFEFHVGTGATTASFLVGQGRTTLNDYISLEGERILEEIKRTGVLNFEMETSALLTLARVFGLRAGSVCAVIANRVTGAWDDKGGIEKACRVGAEAIRRLSVWDSRAAAAGQRFVSSRSISS